MSLIFGTARVLLLATTRVEINTAADDTSSPQVTVSLLTHTLPTAYCHHLTAQEFPFITVSLDNSVEGCGASIVQDSAGNGRHRIL